MKIFIKELIINDEIYKNVLINDLVIFKVKDKKYQFKNNEGLKIKKIIIDKYSFKKIYFYKRCLGKEHTKKFLKWLNINGISNLENISYIEKYEIFQTAPFIGTYKNIHIGTKIIIS